ncbi:hypothetical protein K435DRAFT_874921 [Dendrothele bispora CBS 962.96]|uniref:Uncharacterized protein n=1 Tax=Dendrothele bispora (strain CBS 962.96) TaxID=1314807 RepID=A0A4V4HBM9_DENBC|nr:hypothetical protein K435DRAFT_874921 [Dendrothele bispora CBS 962.96]
MGQAKDTKPQTRKKKTNGKKKLAAQSTEPKRHSDLRKEIHENIKKHGKSEKTHKLYAGHVNRGRDWTKKYAITQKEVEEAWRAWEAGAWSEIDLEVNAELDPEFETCLDGAPVECTPEAIAMYMHEKCFAEGCGKSTVDQVHAAFLLHYNTMKGNKYHESQRFHKDELTQEWVGNPVRSPEVERMLKTCHNKNGEADRNHTRPMTMGDLEKIWVVLQTQCPNDLDNASLKNLGLKTRKLFWNAYSSVGMTLWTWYGFSVINNETAQLKRKHFIFDPPPHPSGKKRTACFKVNLKERKGWQKKMSKNEHQLNGHEFMIYPQPKTPWACMYTHVLAWIEHYEKYFLGPDKHLDPEDYIFPAFNTTWTSLKRQEPISAKSINTLINTAADEAGVKGVGEFTTHCFHRGGAQYRFMYAPIGERWTLARIRWWGGWADGEHRDTLIRYLLDELHTYEEDHSNALCPTEKQEEGTSDHSDHSDSSSLIQSVIKLTSTQQWSSQSNDFISYPSASYPHPVANYYSPNPILYPIVPQHPTTSFQPVIPPTPISVPLGPAVAVYSQIAASTSMSFLSSASNIPIIPPISRSCGSEAWKIAVKDWQYADPSRGLTQALKDWPKEWAAEINRKVHYGHRQMIAKEFLDGYDGDEQAFCMAYPEHKHGITALLNAIRKKHQASGVRQTRQSRKRG